MTLMGGGGHNSHSWALAARSIWHDANGAQNSRQAASPQMLPGVPVRFRRLYRVHTHATGGSMRKKRHDGRMTQPPLTDELYKCAPENGPQNSQCAAHLMPCIALQGFPQQGESFQNSKTSGSGPDRRCRAE